MTFSQRLASVLVLIAIIWPLIPIVDDRPVITVGDIKHLYKEQAERLSIPSIATTVPSNDQTYSNTSPAEPGAAMIIKSTGTSNRTNTTFGTPTFSGRQASLSSETVYFWRHDGIWTFSNLEPENEYETWILDPNENIVSLHSPELERVAAMGNTPSTKQESPASPPPSVEIPSGLPYSDIPQLIENAKNIQKLADQRAKALENIAY